MYNKLYRTNLTNKHKAFTRLECIGIDNEFKELLNNKSVIIVGPGMTKMTNREINQYDVIIRFVNSLDAKPRLKTDIIYCNTMASRKYKPRLAYNNKFVILAKNTAYERTNDIKLRLIHNYKKHEQFKCDTVPLMLNRVLYDLYSFKDIKFDLTVIGCDFFLNKYVYKDINYIDNDKHNTDLNYNKETNQLEYKEGENPLDFRHDIKINIQVFNAFKEKYNIIYEDLVDINSYLSSL